MNVLAIPEKMSGAISEKMVKGVWSVKMKKLKIGFRNFSIQKVGLLGFV